jgi:hypothetical protein
MQVKMAKNGCYPVSYCASFPESSVLPACTGGFSCPSFFLTFSSSCLSLQELVSRFLIVTKSFWNSLYPYLFVQLRIKPGHMPSIGWYGVLALRGSWGKSRVSGENFFFAYNTSN